MKHIRLLPLVAALSAGCAEEPTAPLQPSATSSEARPGAGKPAKHARAELRDARGEVIGTARFTQDGTGRVHLTVHAGGLTPGLHGMHLHTTGACDGSTTVPFSSAGGHFSPVPKEHGFHNPAGHHAGDLPNLIVNGAGVGRLSATADYFGLAELLELDGTALVLHQNEDDLTTNLGPDGTGPGRSGPRIACGVLQAD